LGLAGVRWEVFHGGKLWARSAPAASERPKDIDLTDFSTASSNTQTRANPRQSQKVKPNSANPEPEPLWTTVSTPGPLEGAALVQCLGKDDSQALTEATKAANGGWVIISNGNTCAGSDITIPNLRVEKGGYLKPLTGHTITLGENFEAGPYQAFANALAGQGTISLAQSSSINEILLEWWGARGDDSTDNSAALAAAFGAAGLRKVRVSAGSFRFAKPQILPKNLEGYGMASVLRFMGNGAALSYSNSGVNDNLVVRNLVLRANSDGATHLLKLTSLAVATIDQVHLECQSGCTTAAMELVGSVGMPVQNLDIKNLNISTPAGDGIRAGGPGGVNAMRLIGGRIQGAHGKGINITGTQPNYGIQISGVTVEGNAGGQIYADTLRGSEISGNYIENPPNGTIPLIVGGSLAGSSWLGVSITGGNAFTLVHAPYALDLNGNAASNSVTFSGNDVSGVGPFLQATARFTTVENSIVGPNSLSGYQAPAINMGANARGILITEKVRETGEYVVRYQSGSGRAYIRGDILADTLDVKNRLGALNSDDRENSFTGIFTNDSAYGYQRTIVRPFAGGLSDVLRLEPVFYTNRGSRWELGAPYLGFAIQNTGPEIVHTAINDSPSLSDRAVTAQLVNAVKELSDRLTTVETENNKLRSALRRRK